MILTVKNAQLWAKTFEIEKPVIRIGSGSSADIRIQDDAVLPLHLQFFVGVNSATMRAFDDSVEINRLGRQLICEEAEPYEVFEDDIILMGDYKINFQTEMAMSAMQSNSMISAVLSLSRKALSPEEPIIGKMTVSNLSTEESGQLRMRIEGLPEDCIEIDPMPYLHPGSVGSVGFLIHHRKSHPNPGFNNFSIIIEPANNSSINNILTFRQSIFVHYVSNSVFTLRDDAVKPTRAAESLLKDSVSEIKTTISDSKSAIADDLESRKKTELYHFSTFMQDSPDDAAETGSELKPAQEIPEKQETAPSPAEPETRESTENLPDEAEEEPIRVIANTPNAFRDKPGEEVTDAPVEPVGEAPDEPEGDPADATSEQPAQDAESPDLPDTVLNNSADEGSVVVIRGADAFEDDPFEEETEETKPAIPQNIIAIKGSKDAFD